MSKVKVSSKTINALLKEFQIDKNDEQDFKDEVGKCRSLAEQGTVESIVTACIRDAWDLESFVGWVMKKVENIADCKNLFGEAVFRKGEWDT